VKSCYKSGLAPTEYFFHSMGGREGLVDTAVRTSRSGYMQRRLINALEDLKVMHDGSVRNTAGTIIQFKFGDDGIDPSRGINGKAADIDDILFQLLGDRDDIDLDGKLNVASYGALERDMSNEEGIEDIEIDTEE
ncbi:MAG: DNA-directed RNA polymerase subunit A', partial [Thermoplasmata archaeon]|nr:DNA-directed RNA polymerase subunit A' [Thermoplasmata archaeon]